MADSYVQVPADDVGKKIDAASLDVGANTVQRQRIVIGDNSATAAFATVMASSPTGAESALVVRPLTHTVVLSVGSIIDSISATVGVKGQISLAPGTSVFGILDSISATVGVKGQVSLGPGTSVIGILDSISATVGVKGQVSLGPGTSNIGTINNISATVAVTGTVALAAGSILDSISATVGVKGQVSLAPGTSNIGIINNISATVIVAGIVSIGAGTNNIGFINNISATVIVAGVISLGSGTANIGTINNISASVTVQGNINISNTPSVIIAAGTANIGTLNNISATVVTGLSYVIEKTSNSQVQVGDSANAAIRVNVVAGSAGGPSVNDNSTFTVGAGGAALNPIGAILDDVGPTSASEGAAGILRMTPLRALHTNMRLASGPALDDTANTALRVNVVAGGGAGGGTSMSDRGTFTPGTTAQTPAGGTFNTTATSLSDGEAAAVRITLNRAFHVNLRDNSGGEITAANPLSVKVERTSATDIVVLAAGSANFGTLNNISATVAVTGTVALAAGTVINNISATVIVAGIVSLGAGTANIGTINNISASVTVQGNINISNTPSVILAAGTANFGTLNNISASVNIATGATADFNTSADTTQNLPIFGLALPAAGGASVAGTNAMPLWVNINTVSQTQAVILVAGSANFGTLNNISATVAVTGTVALAAGTVINNISATVAVTGTVALAAGSNNIGTINNISATVAVTGTVALVAGSANIGTINGISATIAAALAAGTNNIGAVSLAAGTQNIGFINNVSATVTTVVRGFTPAIMSASHGPKCVTASTSSNTTLIASPGAGANVYVTQIMCGNVSATLTRARIGTSASVATIVQPLAASGGGFVLNFDPPWMVSASEAVLCSVKPNVADVFFTINFFVI